MELNEIHTDHEQATTSLKVVLLVFAIVLVGALAYLVWAQNTAPDLADNAAVMKKTTSTTPTLTKTDSTDSWKTYTDPTYYYSLKYPADWEVRAVGPGPSNEYLLSWQGANPIGRREDYSASIRVSPKTLEDEVNNTKVTITSSPVLILLSSDSVTFNKYSATAIKFKNKSLNYTDTNYYISHGGYTYIIDGATTSDETDRKIAQAIVDRFAFTK